MTLTISLVTPEREVATHVATYVKVPGSEGSFGVLKGHAPLISLIKEEGGVVEITLETGEVHTYNVEGGFAEVTSTTVSILTERVEQ